VFGDLVFRHLTNTKLESSNDKPDSNYSVRACEYTVYGEAEWLSVLQNMYTEKTRG